MDSLSDPYDPIYNPDSATKQNTTTHGLLMAIAFLIVMPLAILLARHRGLYKQRKVCGLDIWFVLHRGLNVVALVLFIAGFILAFETLPVSPMPSGSVGTAHKAMGITTMALVCIQVLTATFLRPAPDAPKRWLFNVLHHNWGRLAMLCSWAAMILGIYCHHNPLGQKSSIVGHAGAFGAWMVGLLIIDAVLTWLGARSKVEPASSKESTLDVALVQQVPPAKLQQDAAMV